MGGMELSLPDAGELHMIPEESGNQGAASALGPACHMPRFLAQAGACRTDQAAPSHQQASTGARTSGGVLMHQHAGANGALDEQELPVCSTGAAMEGSSGAAG